MAENKNFDVFLSHNSMDKPWVLRLKAALQAQGLRVWLDRDEIRPGDLFVNAIEAGLEESKAVALIVSPEAMQSGWVREEYSHAMRLAQEKNQPLQLIPVILRKAVLPGFLASRNWVDFRDESKFGESLEQLIWGITGKKPSLQVSHTSPLKISISRLPVAGPWLFGREEELKQLDKAWDDPRVHIISLIAWGGVGKSTLVSHWLTNMAQDHYRGAERVYAWSFYNQGTTDRTVSSDLFIESSLRWFGDLDPSQGSPWDKGTRLADL